MRGALASAPTAVLFAACLVECFIAQHALYATLSGALKRFSKRRLCILTPDFPGIGS
jgi:hypothetical protein